MTKEITIEFRSGRKINAKTNTEIEKMIHDLENCNVLELNNNKETMLIETRNIEVIHIR